MHNPDSTDSNGWRGSPLQTARNQPTIHTIMESFWQSPTPRPPSAITVTSKSQNSNNNITNRHLRLRLGRQRQAHHTRHQRHNAALRKTSGHHPFTIPLEDGAANRMEAQQQEAESRVIVVVVTEIILV